MFESLFDNTVRFHFVGIGGAGMSALAELLRKDHYQVSGSDQCLNDNTKRLQQLGAVIYQQHHRQNLDLADIVVISSAIKQDNPEYLAARQKSLPIVKRGALLAQLAQRYKHTITVIGSHGKTTTTALIADILMQANQSPGFAIGGCLNSIMTNNKLGSGHYFIAEGDESDGSFLQLKTNIAIITSISRDHLVYYDNDFAKLTQAFIGFIEKMPDDGLLVLCCDDETIRNILPQIKNNKCQLISYGTTEHADVYASNIQSAQGNSCFEVIKKQRPFLSTKLNIPGGYNILNALAAIIVADYLGVNTTTIDNSLKHFKGVQRRFEYLGIRQFKTVTTEIIHDYGHHPHELAAVIDTVRQNWPAKPIAMVFQPHRYSRTAALFDQFITVLSTVDQLYLLPIYAAHETNSTGISSDQLYQQLLKKNNCAVYYIASLDNVIRELTETLYDNSILLLQGAGDIGQLVYTI
ncbi:MAG: UDP-N-acetylmuramate--L-alanine ligase [Pseudomonadota bacterium]